MREIDVLDTIEQVYSASVNPAEWSVALTAIGDLLGSFDATLEVHTTKHQIPLSFMSGRRIPSDGVADYVEYYSKVCPRLDMRRCKRVNVPGHVGFDYEVMTEAELDADEFYADFLAPHDLRYFISAIMARKGDFFTGLFVHRTPTQGHVDDGDVSLMRQILPHVTAAHDVYRRLGTQKNQHVEIETVLELLEIGTLLLDRSGRVRFANDAACRMLNAADGLSIVDNRLEISDVLAASSFCRILQTMFNGSGEARWEWGGDLQVSRFSECRGYRVSVRRLPKCAKGLIIPCDGAALVFVSEPQEKKQINRDDLISKSGLTEAEADVALAFAKSEDLFEIAQNRAVAISTVRSQLYTLMDKLGLHSQVDLMRFLVSPHSKSNEP